MHLLSKMKTITEPITLQMMSVQETTETVDRFAPTQLEATYVHATVVIHYMLMQGHVLVGR